MLRTDKLSYRINDFYLVKDVTSNFNPREFVVIMGQNGAGKSTLLRLLARSLNPSEGNVLLNDKDIKDFSELELAKIRAVLSQHYDVSFPLTVEEIIMMGRYPYFKTSPAAKDWEIISGAIKLLEIQNFKERNYNTLSGGESQKVQFARVLSQIWEDSSFPGRILLLDEPVSNLDLHFQHEILRIAKSYIHHNMIVIAVLHDINLALNYADRILFMKAGELKYNYDIKDELNKEMIEDVFNVKVKIIENPVNNKPLVIINE